MTKPGFVEKRFKQMIKDLDLEFIGRGEVSGFKFKQVAGPGKDGTGGEVYVYEVDTGYTRYYEVFERVVNDRFGIVSYPSSKSFGVWAWYVPSYDRAMEKREELLKLRDI